MPSTREVTDNLKQALLLALWICALSGLTTPVAAGGFKLNRDAFGYRMCAGYFWAMQQCVVPQFRDAYGSAFMSMARVAASLENKPVPLTQGEATQQLSVMLRDVWQPGRCQDIQQSRDMFGDGCLEMLRE